MQRLTTTPFGRRPVEACEIIAFDRTNRAAPVSQVDKWQILKDLTLARTAINISDRTLSVLQVLVSFHSDRILRDDRALIVYASNATLSERAHGMPESTLRRHLAALVKAGLILRHDSPNGKRYQRRDHAGQVVRAFGFDLRPLLFRAGELAELARAEERRQAERAALREEVVLLVRDANKLSTCLIEMGQPLPDALTDRLRLTRRDLRRQLDTTELEGIRTALKTLVHEVRTRFSANEETQEMSGNDGQNERHKDEHNRKKINGRSQRLNFRAVLQSCPGVLDFHAAPPRDEDAFIAMMAELAPMAGIDLRSWRSAVEQVGPFEAASITATIVQNIGEIQSPSAFLTSRVRALSGGRITMASMLETRTGAHGKGRGVDSCQPCGSVPSGSGTS